MFTELVPSTFATMMELIFSNLSEAQVITALFALSIASVVSL